MTTITTRKEFSSKALQLSLAKRGLVVASVSDAEDEFIERPFVADDGNGLLRTYYKACDVEYDEPGPFEKGSTVVVAEL